MEESRLKYEALLNKARGFNTLPERAINKIVSQVNEQKISYSKAQELLRKLIENPNHNVSIFSESTEDQWSSLADIIIDAEERIKKNTKLQLILGLTLIPLYIFVVIACAILGFYGNEIPITILAILTVSLFAIIVHSFFILRTHQQSSIAIERLAEKRLAILFLKLADNSTHGALDVEMLLNVGTKMFMNHHAPKSRPLTDEDGKVVGNIPNIFGNTKKS